MATDKWVVLVVDDDDDLREIVALEFSGRGFEVRTAASGDEAVEVVQQAPIDLVVSDVRMPFGDGLDLLARIKTMRPPQPAVILMTGFADLNRDKAKALGAAGLIGKPFDRKALFATVRAIQDARA
jgi:CheY-like chemotaxis protein